MSEVLGKRKPGRGKGRRAFGCLALLLSLPWLAVGQKAAPAPVGTEYSGTYSFLREGEFVQVTVEDAGKVSGFVARYGDLESDRGVLLDHFFKSGRLSGNRLMFTTEVVHGIAFAFDGIAGRGRDKKAGEEGDYTFEGKLTETSSDDIGNSSSRERAITLKSQVRKTAAPGAASRE